MALHWTYAECPANSDLEQGDYVVPTRELLDALKQAHPHFTDEKFVGFLVVTQTCDLVRRGAQPKAHYVAIAAVRPLRTVIGRLLSSVCDPWNIGIFPESRKKGARDLLERVFNQNEQGLGVFYLHPDGDVDIAEDSIALLRVTVALKGSHYDALVSARRGRLAPEFQAKLGWLVANLYGRAASPDWYDQKDGKAKLSKLINDYLEDPDICNWADDEALQEAKRLQDAKKEIILPPGQSVAQAVVLLNQRRPAPPDQRIADEAVRALEAIAKSPKTQLELTEDHTKAFRNKLLNSKIAQILKRSEV